MKRFLGMFSGVLYGAFAMTAFAAEKYDILPDLPEPLAAAQASSVSTLPDSSVLSGTTQSIGQEPNILSVIFSLVFVVLLIYATGIIYTKLNKMSLKTLKKQVGDLGGSKVSVVSTTPLGSNKTLHVVELDGKRMLIGASSNAIQLIKDLGSYPPEEFEEGEYSKIEIPNIRIPKIEIPKIEFPNIGFTKIVGKNSFKEKNIKEETTKEETTQETESDDFIISDIYEEGPDGIIDKLFQPSSQDSSDIETTQAQSEHMVDPDEFALYKKYL